MGIWQESHSKLWLRSVAMAVVITFTVTTVAWADGQGGIISSLQKDIKSIPVAPTNSAQDFLADLNRISIPSEIGVVKSAFQGAQDRLVVHIQDAHVNEEAQRNIARIIEYIAKTKGGRLVAVEGASGELDTALYAAFPDAKAREVVADYYLREGILTGPEHIAITKFPQLKLFGAEEKGLYEENRSAFLNSLEFKDRSAQAVEEIKSKLDQISRFVFSDELRNLRSEHEGFTKQKEYLNHFVRYLLDLSDRLNVSRFRYRQIDAFMNLIKLEREIDFEKAEKEIDSLIADLKKILSHEELSEFVTNSIQFRLKKMTRAEYYGYLEEKVSAHSEEQTHYQNVIKYLNYTRQYDSIGVELFAEIDQLEEAVKNKLFRNESEVTLDRLYRFANILEHMFDFSLTKEDVDYFYSYRAEFKAETFRLFVDQEANKANQTLSLPKSIDVIDDDLPRIEQFYKAALKRDKILMERTYQKMVKENERVSVIVTGGFHTAGIERYLKEKDISYLVIAPRITKAIDEKKEAKLYEVAMRNLPTRLEKMLSEVYLPPKAVALNDPRYQLAQPKMMPSFLDDVNILRNGPTNRVKEGAMFLAVLTFKADNVRSELRKLTRNYFSMAGKSGVNFERVRAIYNPFLQASFVNGVNDKIMLMPLTRSELRNESYLGFELMPAEGKEFRVRSELRQRGGKPVGTVDFGEQKVGVYRVEGYMVDDMKSTNAEVRQHPKTSILNPVTSLDNINPFTGRPLEPRLALRSQPEKKERERKWAVGGPKTPQVKPVETPAPEIQSVPSPVSIVEKPALPRMSPAQEVINPKIPGQKERILEGLRITLYAVLVYLAIPVGLSFLALLLPGGLTIVLVNFLLSSTFLGILLLPFAAFVIKTISERNTAVRVPLPQQAEQMKLTEKIPPEKLNTTDTADWLMHEIYKNSPRGDYETLVQKSKFLGIFPLGATKVKGFVYHDYVPALGHDPSIDEIVARIALQYGLEKQHVIALAQRAGVGMNEKNRSQWLSIFDALKNANKSNYVAFQSQKEHGFFASLLEALKAPLSLIFPRLLRALLIVGPHVLVQFFYGFWLRAIGYEWVVSKRDYLGRERSLEVLGSALLAAKQPNFGRDFTRWKQGTALRKIVYYTFLSHNFGKKLANQLQYGTGRLSAFYRFLDHILIQPLLVPLVQFLEKRWKLALYGAMGLGLLTLLPLPAGLNVTFTLGAWLVGVTKGIPILGVAIHAFVHAFEIFGFLNTLWLSMLLVIPNYAKSYIHRYSGQYILGRLAASEKSFGRESLLAKLLPNYADNFEKALREQARQKGGLLKELQVQKVGWFNSSTIERFARAVSAPTSDLKPAQKAQVFDELLAILGHVRFSDDRERFALQERLESLYSKFSKTERQVRAPPAPGLLKSLIVYPLLGIFKALAFRRENAGFYIAFFGTVVGMLTVGAEIAGLAGETSGKEMGIGGYLDQGLTKLTGVDIPLFSHPINLVERNALGWGQNLLHGAENVTHLHVSDNVFALGAKTLHKVGIKSEPVRLAQLGFTATELSSIRNIHSAMDDVLNTPSGSKAHDLLTTVSRGEKAFSIPSIRSAAYAQINHLIVQGHSEKNQGIQIAAQPAPQIPESAVQAGFFRFSTDALIAGLTAATVDATQAFVEQQDLFKLTPKFEELMKEPIYIGSPVGTDKDTLESDIRADLASKDPTSKKVDAIYSKLTKAFPGKAISKSDIEKQVKTYEKEMQELTRDGLIPGEYPIWGISPTWGPDGKFEEYGSPLGSINKVDQGYPGNRDVVAPDASILALSVAPKEVIGNLKVLRARHPQAYNENYGFIASVNLETGATSDTFVTDNQGFAFLQIVNTLTKGSIRNYFHHDEIIKKSEGLLKESFERLPSDIPLNTSAELNLEDQAYLKEIARSTWNYFSKTVGKDTNYLPVDHMKTTGEKADYVGITGVGLYLMSVVGAREVGLISKEEASDRINRTLQTLKKLDRWEGLFHQYYQPGSLNSPGENDQFISAVDNGWLGTALVVIRNAFPEMKDRVNPILNGMNFSKLYDLNAEKLRNGYNPVKSEYTPSHYGLIYTEIRPTLLLGIGKGDLPESIWQSTGRTLPTNWDWQAQTPVDGYYQRTVTIGGKERVINFIPSWGGSALEALAPTVVMDEKGKSPNGFGRQNEVFVFLQKNYASEKANALLSKTVEKIVSDLLSEKPASLVPVVPQKAGVLPEVAKKAARVVEPQAKALTQKEVLPKPEAAAPITMKPSFSGVPSVEKSLVPEKVISLVREKISTEATIEKTGSPEVSKLAEEAKGDQAWVNEKVEREMAALENELVNFKLPQEFYDQSRSLYRSYLEGKITADNLKVEIQKLFNEKAFIKFSVNIGEKVESILVPGHNTATINESNFLDYIAKTFPGSKEGKVNVKVVNPDRVLDQLSSFQPIGVLVDGKTLPQKEVEAQLAALKRKQIPVLFAEVGGILFMGDFFGHTMTFGIKGTYNPGDSARINASKGRIMLEGAKTAREFRNRLITFKSMYLEYDFVTMQANEVGNEIKMNQIFGRGISKFLLDRDGKAIAADEDFFNREQELFMDIQQRKGRVDRLFGGVFGIDPAKETVVIDPNFAQKLTQSKLPEDIIQTPSEGVFNRQQELAAEIAQLDLEAKRAERNVEAVNWELHYDLLFGPTTSVAASLLKTNVRFGPHTPDSAFLWEQLKTEESRFVKTREYAQAIENTQETVDTLRALLADGFTNSARVAERLKQLAEQLEKLGLLSEEEIIGIYELSRTQKFERDAIITVLKRTLTVLQDLKSDILPPQSEVGAQLEKLNTEEQKIRASANLLKKDHARLVQIEIQRKALGRELDQAIYGIEAGKAYKAGEPKAYQTKVFSDELLQERLAKQIADFKANPQRWDERKFERLTRAMSDYVKLLQIKAYYLKDKQAEEKLYQTMMDGFSIQKGVIQKAFASDKSSEEQKKYLKGKLHQLEREEAQVIVSAEKDGVSLGVVTPEIRAKAQGLVSLPLETVSAPSGRISFDKMIQGSITERGRVSDYQQEANEAARKKVETMKQPKGFLSWLQKKVEVVEIGGSGSRSTVTEEVIKQKPVPLPTTSASSTAGVAPALRPTADSLAGTVTVPVTVPIIVPLLESKKVETSQTKDLGEAHLILKVKKGDVGPSLRLFEAANQLLNGDHQVQDVNRQYHIGYQIKIGYAQLVAELKTRENLLKYINEEAIPHAENFVKNDESYPLSPEFFRSIAAQMAKQITRLKEEINKFPGEIKGAFDVSQETAQASFNDIKEQVEKGTFGVESDIALYRFSLSVLDNTEFKGFAEAGQLYWSVIAADAALRKTLQDEYQIELSGTSAGDFFVALQQLGETPAKLFGEKDASVLEQMVLKGEINQAKIKEIGIFSWRNRSYAIS